MWWKWLLFIGMSTLIVMSFVTPAPQSVIGESSRILYYHVPLAWICVLAFLVSVVFSIRYLSNRAMIEDGRAVAAATLGFVFCLLATATGSIFARVTWGSFWNWDPRQISIFILLMIYGAYFALRRAIDREDRCATLSAVYSILAFVTVPFLVFVMPRIVPSLHPSDAVVNEDLSLTMGGVVRIIFSASLALFTALFFWIYSLAHRIQSLRSPDMEEDW